MRARPRFNKDEVDDEDDVVDDDAIRCKVLGETDDDDFRNKTRAMMADIYILRTSSFCNKFCRQIICVFELRKREKRENAKNFFFTLLCCFCLSFVVLLYNNYHRLIENKVSRINSVVAVVIASQSSTVCG